MSEQRLSDLRLGCRLFGCGPYGYACERCGTGIYDSDYIEAGWLWLVFYLRNRIRSAIYKPKLCLSYIEETDDVCLLNKGHEGACDDIPF